MRSSKSLPRGTREFLSRCHAASKFFWRSEEHTSELQSRENLVCRLLLEKKKKLKIDPTSRFLAHSRCERRVNRFSTVALYLDPDAVSPLHSVQVQLVRC